MISNLSNMIARYLLQEKIIEEHNLPVYTYGLEIIISTMVGVVLILLIGLLTSSLVDAIIFYCLFIVLRFFTGGYHADTHFRCKLTLVLCYLLMLVMERALEPIYTPFLNMGIQIFYMIIVFLLAPVEHLNAPMTDEEAQKNRMIAIAMAFVMLITTMMLSFDFSSLARTASLTQFVVAVLIIIPKVIKGGEEHERTEEESSQEGGKSK